MPVRVTEIVHDRLTGPDIHGDELWSTRRESCVHVSPLYLLRRYIVRKKHAKRLFDE